MELSAYLPAHLLGRLRTQGPRAVVSYRVLVRASVGVALKRAREIERFSRAGFFLQQKASNKQTRRISLHSTAVPMIRARRRVKGGPNRNRRGAAEDVRPVLAHKQPHNCTTLLW